MPRGDELGERLASVLEVIYLIFNEGYAATAGDDWMRPALCEDALRLGRILAELAAAGAGGARAGRADGDPGVARPARASGPGGEPILLLEQDRGRWDPLLIRRGLACARPRRAPAAGRPGRTRCRPRSPRATRGRATADETDWAADRRALRRRSPRSTPSPVVELNRAVAVSMADGPAAGLALADELADEPALRGYHLLPSVRGDLLAKLGRAEEARAEFERAASLTENLPERALLLERAAACDS